MRDMFSVSNCIGYIRMSRDSVGQAQRAASLACMKDW